MPTEPGWNPIEWIGFVGELATRDIEGCLEDANSAYVTCWADCTWLQPGDPGHPWDDPGGGGGGGGGGGAGGTIGEVGDADLASCKVCTDWLRTGDEYAYIDNDGAMVVVAWKSADICTSFRLEPGIDTNGDGFCD